ncbi:MAG: prepilin-type N-terminal cleavage/methylation domain-containing protein [Alphaproteobacteria bacterium]|nr:prepilin-type N-terminal cleavage/methylation domain-containing protein [Alphaproteobacteria bacterium]
MPSMFRNNKTSPKRSLQRGFTLIEMALVLAIMGVVGVIYLEAGIAVSDQHNMANAINEMEDLQNAIIDFTVRSHRLPCPADPDLVFGNNGFGEEDTTVVATSPLKIECNRPTGVIPWNNFGMLEEVSIDPWGQKYEYIVKKATASLSRNKSDLFYSPCNDDNVAGEGGTSSICARYSLGGLDFRYVPYGGGKFKKLLEDFEIKVGDLNSNLLADKIAYAIVSSGPNRKFEQVGGTYEITQDVKCYEGAPCSSVATDVFDDIVVHPSLVSIIRASNHTPNEIDSGS